MARKVKVLDEIESMHQWLDEKDQLRSITPKFEAGAILDADAFEKEGVENVEKWFGRLISTGHASEDMDAALLDHPANAVPAERAVPREEPTA